MSISKNAPIMVSVIDTEEGIQKLIPHLDRMIEGGLVASSSVAENHVHMLAIYYMYYNYCRVHQTLRVTPAMEAGLAHRIWEVGEIVALRSSRSILDGFARKAA